MDKKNSIPAGQNSSDLAGGQSFKHVSLTAVLEPEHPTQNLKPADSYETWQIVNENTHGLDTIRFSAVVSTGGDSAKHALVPALSIWPLGTDPPRVDANPEDTGAFEKHREGERDSPAKETEAFFDTEVGSAVLVMDADGARIGIRVKRTGGNFGYFSFRAPAELRAIKVHKVDVLSSGDLLSMATREGRPGQSPCNCNSGCRLDATKFKELVKTADAVLPEQRTEASHAIDLAAFDAKTTKKPAPVNGVSKKMLVPVVPPENSVADPLHLFLGKGNDHNRALRGDLAAIDKTDPVARAEMARLGDVILELHADCEKVLGEAVKALDAGVPGGPGTEAMRQEEEEVGGG